MSEFSIKILIELSTGFVMYCWFILAIDIRKGGITRTKKLIGLMGVFAISLSWGMLALLIISPSLLFEPHVPYQFGVLFLGIGTAIVGGVLGVIAKGRIYKPYGISSGVYISLWLAVLLFG